MCQDDLKSAAPGGVVWTLGNHAGTSKETESGVQMPVWTSEMSLLTWSRWWGQLAGDRPDSVHLANNCHRVGLLGDRGGASRHPTPPHEKQPSFTYQFCIHTRERIQVSKNSFAAATCSVFCKLPLGLTFQRRRERTREACSCEIVSNI